MPEPEEGVSFPVSLRTLCRDSFSPRGCEFFLTEGLKEEQGDGEHPLEDTGLLSLW